MFLLKGDACYIDVLERALYNNMLAGVSLKGDTFFYPNVLEFDGKATFNYGVAGRSEWFNCSCCPSNVSRFIPSLPGYVYSTGDNAVYVNLYLGNEADMQLGDIDLKLRQETSYPWSGSVRITVNPNKAADFSIKLRIPGWVEGRPVPGDLYRFADQAGGSFKASVNGEPVSSRTSKGYLTITRKWTGGDTILLDLPMPARIVKSHPMVDADAGRIAVQRGPLVYCAEGIDNQGQALSLTLAENPEFSESFLRDTLQGVLFLASGSGNRKVTLVPYYAWANREIGEMKVWFPVE